MWNGSQDSCPYLFNKLSAEVILFLLCYKTNLSSGNAYLFIYLFISRAIEVLIKHISEQSDETQNRFLGLIW